MPKMKEAFQALRWGIYEEIFSEPDQSHYVEKAPIPGNHCPLFSCFGKIFGMIDQASLSPSLEFLQVGVDLQEPVITAFQQTLTCFVANPLS